MSQAPLMPMATAVWLVENTSLTFKQIAEFQLLMSCNQLFFIPDLQFRGYFELVLRSQLEKC